MRYISIIITIASILGCSNQSSHHVEHLDIEGIPLVRTINGPKYSGPLFNTSSEIIIGIDEGEPEWQLFFGSPRILIAPDGTIILVDPRRFEIFIVSKEGQLLSSSHPETVVF